MTKGISALFPTMTRKTLIQIHLILSSFLLPFLLLMPITGGLYLIGEKGAEQKEVAFTIDSEVPADKKARVDFFKKVFAEKQLNFNFMM